MQQIFIQATLSTKLTHYEIQVLGWIIGNWHFCRSKNDWMLTGLYSN